MLAVNQGAVFDDSSEHLFARRQRRGHLAHWMNRRFVLVARVAAIRRNDDAFTLVYVRAFAWYVEVACMMTRSRVRMSVPLRGVLR